MCLHYYIISVFAYYYIIRLAGAKIYDVESLRRRVHCSLPLRQLSELGYLLQCFNSFICHLASLPIRHFGKLLRKTSANFFGKLQETPENYFGKLRKNIDENSKGRNLWTKTPQTEASGKCSSIFCPHTPASGRNAQRRQGK